MLGEQGSVADTGFHEGELLVQRRAGVADEAQRLAGMVASPRLSGGMSRFVAERELVFITATDDDGTLWTSPVFGPRGFCRGDGATLTIAGAVADGDPLEGLPAGRSLGVLLVDFARRRRLRVNGIVTRAGAGGLEVSVEQAFGNCPRYIHPHHVGAGRARAGVTRRRAELEPEHIAQIVRADTFVLGTIHPDRGADTSHRGGEPGFVRWVDGELWWPDYPGNNLFNSIGNLVVNPAASLLFLDDEHGTRVQLSGRGVVEWIPDSGPHADGETGRRIRFVPEEIAVSGQCPRNVPPHAKWSSRAGGV